MSIYYCL